MAIVPFAIRVVAADPNDREMFGEGQAVFS